MKKALGIVLCFLLYLFFAWFLPFITFEGIGKFVLCVFCLHVFVPLMTGIAYLIAWCFT